MDMLINRLYRTRLQFSYENQSNPEQSASKGSQTQHAYAGSDTAEISPLAIVFYTTAQNPEGQFEDLSDQFSKSPFAQNLEDYSDQAKKLVSQQSKRNDSDKPTFSKDLIAEAESKDQTFTDPFEQNVKTSDISFRQRLQVQLAYNQMSIPSDYMYQQQMVNVFA